MHSSYDMLQSITVILMFAGVVGALLSVIRVPGVLAFIFTGILIGPGGLGLVSSTEIIHTIAELGIIFLLFVLGAELSLPRLREMRIHSLWAGVLQMVITLVVMAAGFYLFGLSPRIAIFLGGALALSSTAIVLKMLGEEGEMDAPHGRITMGILIVQDLSLVPLMAFMPLLTGQGLESGGNLLQSLGWVLLKSGLFLGTVILMSWRFVPRLIDRIAATSSKEIFAVFVVAFSLLIAVVSNLVGLSYAVGAFVAGLALTRSVTSRQIIADSIPFRDIFSTVFFVSVGMLMNTGFFMSHIPQILLLTAVIVGLKLFTVGLSVYLLRFPWKTVFWCALSLFQVGEFSFILLQLGLQSKTLDEPLINTVTSATILTMLLTPLFIRLAPKLIAWLEKRNNNMLEKLDAKLSQERIAPLKDEVIVAGYGPIAKNIIQVLKSHEIGFKVIEMNVNTVKKLQMQGIHCVFGDASNMEVLHHAGLQDAKVLALTIPDIRSAELALQNAKRINPDIYCIVRSRYQHPLQTLFKLGADEVVYEEFESSMSFVHSILDLFGDTVTDKESYMMLLRENRQALLRTGKSMDDQARYGRFSVFKETKIEWIAIPEGSPLVGMTLADAALRQKTGVNVLSVIEADGLSQITPEPETVIQPNQVLVVIGSLEQLTTLEALLC